MQALQVISLTLLSILAASAQTIRPGKCPTPPVQADFDAARYLGRWYEIQKLPAAFQRGECGQVTYGQKSPGVVSVLNEELLKDGTVNSITGWAKPRDPAEPAKLEVTFDFEGSRPGPYWVLSTDYTGHTLVYSCTDLGLFHFEFAWILSREPSMPAETLEEIHSILTSNGIKINNLQTTDHSNCSTMPE